MPSNLPRVIIPAAGRGSRFVEDGYVSPKPYLAYRNSCILAHVIDMFPQEWEKSVVIQRDHKMYFDLEVNGRSNWDPEKDDLCEIDWVTKGAALTVLHSVTRTLSKTGEDFSFFVCNSDNLFSVNLEIIYGLMDMYPIDNGLLSFKTKDDLVMYERGPWSYVSVNEYNDILQVSEKIKISDLATAGLYYFGSAIEFSRAVLTSVKNKDEYNGEYYLAPIYNHLPGRNVCYQMDRKDMLSFGTPADYVARLNNKYEIPFSTRGFTP